VGKIKSKRIGIAIDMTPLVDVAFLLPHLLHDDDAVPAAREGADHASRVVFGVQEAGDAHHHGERDSGGRIRLEFVQAREKKSQLVDASTFGGWLETARYADPSAYVLLKADKDAPYGVVEQIMKELQSQNANRFNIITDAKKKARMARGHA
jgi:hypothetical protein